MSDIVEELIKDSALVMDARTLKRRAASEIETLRHRVKELIEHNNHLFDEGERAKIELATLKQVQSEPATVVVDLQAQFPAGAIYPPLPIGTKLYTSAPTIPEGIVTLQSGSDGVWAHFRIGKGYAFSYNLDTDKLGKRFANEYRAMLSAAPKPGEKS